MALVRTEQTQQKATLAQMQATLAMVASTSAEGSQSRKARKKTKAHVHGVSKRARQAESLSALDDDGDEDYLSSDGDE